MFRWPRTAAILVLKFFFRKLHPKPKLYIKVEVKLLAYGCKIKRGS